MSSTESVLLIHECMKTCLLSKHTTSFEYRDGDYYCPVCDNKVAQCLVVFGSAPSNMLDMHERLTALEKQVEDLAGYVSTHKSIVDHVLSSVQELKNTLATY